MSISTSITKLLARIENVKRILAVICHKKTAREPKNHLLAQTLAGSNESAASLF
jgi:hypothetical protein